MIFGAFTDWDFTYWWYSLAARLEWYLWFTAQSGAG